MKEPLISVIVPVFNVEEYISDCIESIQKQTYRNLQIILVDDGSADRSGTLCDKHASLDQRIEVIHKANGGLVSARKAGLAAAKGMYIGFVDGDDFIEPDMYRALMHEMEASKADLVHSGYWEGNTKQIPFAKAAVEFSTNRKQFLEGVLLGLEGYAISYSIWSKLFCRELIQKSYGQVPDNCSYGEDVINHCICILECNKIALLDEAYYHYRVRDGSLSHKNDVGLLRNIFVLYENLSGILSFYGYYDQDVMNRVIWRELLKHMAWLKLPDFQIATYYYGDVERLEGKNIVIYGAGRVGRDYYAQISRYMDCRVAAWVDADPSGHQYPHIHVDEPDVLSTVDFDIVLIAVQSESVAGEICGQLIKRGIPQDKIHWSEPEVYALEA